MSEYLIRFRPIQDTVDNSTIFEITTNRQVYRDIWGYINRYNCTDGKPYREYNNNIMRYCKENNIKYY